MQHTTGVAVVATQLADTDRRALSQAWYSALHLADHVPRTHHAPLAAPPRSSPCANAGAAFSGSGALPDARVAGDAQPSRAGARTPVRREDSAETAERRMPKSELARRIERGLAQRAPRERAASFTVPAADGRVQLVVRCDGTRTRVVAVCAPALRERVERALAQARFALAGCGVRAEAA